MYLFARNNVQSIGVVIRSFVTSYFLILRNSTFLSSVKKQNVRKFITKFFQSQFFESSFRQINTNTEINMFRYTLNGNMQGISPENETPFYGKHFFKMLVHLFNVPFSGVRLISK
jgi:hypothetical protein